MLPVCESWEDHLWAHLNAIFEDRIDQIVAHSSVPPTYFARTSFKTSLEPTAKDLAMAFDALLQRPGRVGTEARHPLRMTIACVAQDELSRLFQDFVSTMEQSGGDLDPEFV